MKKSILIVALSLILNSCMSIAWIGYDKPSDSDYSEINNSPIKIGLQNLKKTDQLNAIREATSEVFIIFNSDEFKRRVESKEWLISCTIKDDGSKDIWSGKEVYNTLINGFVDFSVNPRHPWRAVAQTQKHLTDHTKNRVAIKPKRIKTWNSNTNETKSKLINTIAHEISHTTSFKFSDSGHGTLKCPDAELVSYGIGNLVEELWLLKN